jgi:hypothetical protein
MVSRAQARSTGVGCTAALHRLALAGEVCYVQVLASRTDPALTLSSSIFCTMKVATVLDSSLPVSMVRRQSGIISVDSRKLMTSVSSTLTSAPITPRLVSRRYSNGRVLLTVLRKGYRNSGMWAAQGRDGSVLYGEPGKAHLSRGGAARQHLNKDPNVNQFQPVSEEEELQAVPVIMHRVTGHLQWPYAAPFLQY